MSSLEPLLDLSQIRRPAVIRQALHKHSAVLLFQDAIIEQRQQAAIVQRTNQPAEALFQRDHRRRDLIIEKRIAAALINSFDTRCDNWIRGNRKRKPVDNHTAELLTLYIYS